jgi:hypothetical protein
MKTVWVTYTLSGFHHWEQAPEEVAYLRSSHRHLFGFRVEVEVSHSEREVEYHQLQKEAIGLSYPILAEAESSGSSCETMASQLYTRLEKAGYSVYSVAVDEDGECGSTIYAQDRRGNEEVE